MKGNELELWIASSTIWNFITVLSNRWMLIVNKYCAIFISPYWAYILCWLSGYLGRLRRCPFNRGFTVFHHYLDKNRNKKDFLKSISNSHISLSFFSFGIETMNTFIHSRSSLENQNPSRPKLAKSIPVFRPKRRKNITLWGGTYIHGFYKGVLPPGLSPSLS